MVIRADYCLIDSKLCDLAGIVRDIRKETEHLEEVIENLGIFWESDAGSEYAIRITADLVVMAAITEKISLTVHGIRESIQRLDDAEKSVGELILYK